jgi:hypothetical protein
VRGLQAGAAAPLGLQASRVRPSSPRRCAPACWCLPRPRVTTPHVPRGRGDRASRRPTTRLVPGPPAHPDRRPPASDCLVHGAPAHPDPGRPHTPPGRAAQVRPGLLPRVPTSGRPGSLPRSYRSTVEERYECEMRRWQDKD